MVRTYPRLIYIHMRIHMPHIAMTLEMFRALPHSLLIRQFLVPIQHFIQPFSEDLLSDLLGVFSGCVCFVSGCFSSQSSVAPFPMMHCFRARLKGICWWCREVIVRVDFHGVGRIAIREESFGERYISLLELWTHRTMYHHHPVNITPMFKTIICLLSNDKAVFCVSTLGNFNYSME